MERNVVERLIQNLVDADAALTGTLLARMADTEAAKRTVDLKAAAQNLASALLADALGSPRPEKNEQTFVRTFLSLLPDDIGAPEIVIEVDGDLGFDWDKSRTCVVSASLNVDGRIAWAALVGDWIAHGNFMLPAWPDEFAEALRRFTASAEVVSPSTPTHRNEKVIIMRNGVEYVIAHACHRGLGCAACEINDLKHLIEIMRPAAEVVSQPPQEGWQSIAEAETLKNGTPILGFFRGWWGVVRWHANEWQDCQYERRELSHFQLLTRPDEPPSAEGSIPSPTPPGTPTP